MDDYYNQMKKNMEQSNLTFQSGSSVNNVAWNNPSKEEIQIAELKLRIEEMDSKFKLIELLLPGVFGKSIGVVDE